MYRKLEYESVVLDEYINIKSSNWKKLYFLLKSKNEDVKIWISEFYENVKLYLYFINLFIIIFHLFILNKNIINIFNLIIIYVLF